MSTEKVAALCSMEAAKLGMESARRRIALDEDYIKRGLTPPTKAEREATMAMAKAKGWRL